MAIRQYRIKNFLKKLLTLKDIWILFHSLTKSEECAFFIYCKARESESCSVVSSSLRHHGLYSPWNSPGQNTGVGSLSLLQGIFPTQGLNPGLPHCRWILYQLSHEGRPRILEWVVYPFSSGSSPPRNRTGVSCIAGGFFTNWVIRETRKAHILFFFFNCNAVNPCYSQTVYLWFAYSLNLLSTPKAIARHFLGHSPVCRAVTHLNQQNSRYQLRWNKATCCLLVSVHIVNRCPHCASFNAMLFTFSWLFVGDVTLKWPPNILLSVCALENMCVKQTLFRHDF